jgi:UDP-glucose 4-epimerase
VEVIVTGGAGYIGAHIVNDLLENNYKVIVIDNFSTGFTTFVDKRSTLITGSAGDSQILEVAFSSLKFPNSAAVIHCAGLKFAGESIKKPIEFYVANLSTTLNLLKYMKKFNVLKLIFSSSSSVYGNSDLDILVSESSNLNPLSPYGKSKLFAENIIDDSKKEFGLNATSLRYFNVIGNGSIAACDTSKWNLLPNIYRAIDSNTPLQIYGGNYLTPDGSCIRDYVDVVSIARAHRQILEEMNNNTILPDAINLGSESGTSVLEIFKAVKASIDPNFTYNLTQVRTGDPARIIADCTTARKCFDWSPSLSIEESIISGWKAYDYQKVLF